MKSCCQSQRPGFNNPTPSKRSPCWLVTGVQVSIGGSEGAGRQRLGVSHYLSQSIKTYHYFREKAFTNQHHPLLQGMMEWKYPRYQ